MISEIIDSIKKINTVSSCDINILNIKDQIINNEYSDVYTVGTRPRLLYKMDSNNIIIKRNYEVSGFTKSCRMLPFSTYKKYDNAIILEDVAVTGKTLDTVISNLGKFYSNVNVEIQFIYEETYLFLCEKYPFTKINYNRILKEKPIYESTCVFISDLLFGRINDQSYYELLINKNALGNSGNLFLKNIVKKYGRYKIKM